MPDATLINTQILRRIAQSSHTLTVNYPASRPALQGDPTATAPRSPLTGAPASHALREPAVTPAKLPVTLQCLWLDASQQSDVRRNAIMPSNYGWATGAQALARVAIADAGATPDDTVFTGCDYVEHMGQRFKVLGVVPTGASFGPPATYYVWLARASATP